ncbi:putative permease component of ABC transporter [alpha proteobacterium BAL199]|jgi:ABC-type branched-subunit amino acid transport system permease subunit|nr:putative permease component of ABC transporter [alpha proteobacterium BAL199]
METTRDWTIPGVTVGFAAVAVLGLLFLPDWLMNLTVIAFARALAVVGLMVLWRTGLVSFGHALYFGLGAYTVALLGKDDGISEVLITLPAATLVAATVGLFLGFIVRRYREIFFAMLSLAFSMVLYGILVKTEALGSTDGFNVRTPTFLGFAPEDAGTTLRAIFLVLCALCWTVAVLVHRYLQSTLGRLTTAIRDNEIRVEYLGYSVAQAIHGKYVMSAALAGLGGGILAIALGQVDPDSMVNWTVSGELVFVTILSGPGSVAAPFIGSMIYELIRTYAFEWLPHAWQLIVGVTLLSIIFFLPGGVWSLLARLRRREVE